ncbi:signal peptidase I [Eubacterium saphenum ATCC 49989]|nr:signal peptidase I [Eubacterium saphenum ATCC 49989]
MENYEEKKNGTVSTVVSYLIVIVMTILIGITFVKTTIVRQTSMLPTLQDGNYLLLSKQAYVFNEFKHEDIVVFDSGERAYTTGSLLNFDNKKYYIKRIIGLPGDEITIKNKKVYRNGKEIDQSYTLDKATETNGNGQVEVNKLKIPKGKLFVLGDNRYNSADSRSTDVGLVSMDKVYGKAVLRIFPFKYFKKF